MEQQQNGNPTLFYDLSTFQGQSRAGPLNSGKWVETCWKPTGAHQQWWETARETDLRLRRGPTQVWKAQKTREVQEGCPEEVTFELNFEEQLYFAQFKNIMEGRKHSGGELQQLAGRKTLYFGNMEVTRVFSACHKVAPDAAGEI